MTHYNCPGQNIALNSLFLYMNFLTIYLFLVPPTQMFTQNDCQCEKQNNLPDWAFALIVFESAFALIVLIGIIGLLVYKFRRSMFFASKVPIQDTDTSADTSYTSV